MPPFITDNSRLNFPKSDRAPLAGGKDPASHLTGSEWNKTCQAVIDIRAWIISGSYIGFVSSSTDPHPQAGLSGTVGRIWLSSSLHPYVSVTSSAGTVTRKIVLAPTGTNIWTGLFSQVLVDAQGIVISGSTAAAGGGYSTIQAPSGTSLAQRDTLVFSSEFSGSDEDSARTNLYLATTLSAHTFSGPALAEAGVVSHKATGGNSNKYYTLRRGSTEAAYIGLNNLDYMIVNVGAASTNQLTITTSGIVQLGGTTQLNGTAAEQLYVQNVTAASAALRVYKNVTGAAEFTLATFERYTSVPLTIGTDAYDNPVFFRSDSANTTPLYFIFRRNTSHASNGAEGIGSGLQFEAERNTGTSGSVGRITAIADQTGSSGLVSHVTIAPHNNDAFTNTLNVYPTYLSITGSLTSSDGIKTNLDLEVGRNLTIGGALSLASLTASSGIKALDLEATRNLTVGGVLSLSSLTASSGIKGLDLEATRNLTVAHDTTVASLTASAAIRSNYMVIVGTPSLADPVDFYGMWCQGKNIGISGGSLVLNPSTWGASYMILSNTTTNQAHVGTGATTVPLHLCTGLSVLDHLVLKGDSSKSVGIGLTSANVAARLHVSGGTGFRVDATGTINGDFKCGINEGSKVGFFGNPLINQPTVSGATTDDKVTSIITALSDLGLVQDGT